MAWVDSNRKQELPSNWQALRKKILDRDNHECTWIERDENGILRKCGKPANQVDHKRRGNNHHPDNLRSLCEHHHARKSASEGNLASREKRAEIRKRFRKPTEVHPALLKANR